MDAAAPRAEPKPRKPLFPPNYVSLRHLQQLRLKEKEEQRQREEEEAAARRVRGEKQQQEKEAAERRVKEQERKRKREEEAAARRVKEEERKREEEAAARRVKEEERKLEEESAARSVKEAAAPKPEKKALSNTLSRHTDRSRGGQRFMVVDRRPPPLRGDGTAQKKDASPGAGYHGEKGTDGESANAPNGGGRKAKNKGKEKVSVDRKGEPGELEIAPSRPGKLEEKRKVEALGDQGMTLGASDTPGEEKRKVHALGNQGTQSETSNTPGKPAEAAILSSQRSPRKPKGKKGSGDWRTRTAMASQPADASLTQGTKSANQGTKKILEDKCTDLAPISDLPDGKSLQPPNATKDSLNRRRRSGQGINLEAKSKVAGMKQSAVEVKTQACPSAEGISNNRSGGGQGMNPEAQSKVPEKKQTMLEVKTQPRPSSEGSSNQRRGNGQGTTHESKSEGLGEKQAVVMTRPTAGKMPRGARSSGRQQFGSWRGNGAAPQHDVVWMPKPVVLPANAEVD